MKKIFAVLALLIATSTFAHAQPDLVGEGWNGTTDAPLATYYTGAPSPASQPVVVLGLNPTGVQYGSYLSGITATGLIGQTCTLTGFNNGSTATATVALTAINYIAPNTPLAITAAGTGATARPTSATAGNGSATCSGTAVLNTGIGSYGPILVDANGNIVAGGFNTGASLPATCSSNPMAVFAVVTAGAAVPYYCSSANTWAAFGGSGSGTVTSFAAPSASWPAWLVPTVATSTTTPSLAVAASTIPIAAGGTNGTTAAAALISLFPTASEVGDLVYCATYSSGCTSWALLAGNTSGTKYLQETAVGAPSWTSPSGSGLAYTSPTLNYIPKVSNVTSPGTVVNSALDDGATTANTLTYGGSGGITASAGAVTSGNPSGGVGSHIYMTQEGTIPSGLCAAGQDNTYADSTQHGLLGCDNNGSVLPYVQGPASETSGHLATWSGTNGGKLVDGGAVPTGTVNSGTATNFTYYAATGTAVSGTPKWVLNADNSVQAINSILGPECPASSVSGSTAINLDTANCQEITITAATTISLTNTNAAGGPWDIEFCNNASTTATNWTLPGSASALAVPTLASKCVWNHFTYDGTNYNPSPSSTELGVLRGPESAAPGTPAASTFVTWWDSTDHDIEVKQNNSANIFKGFLSGQDCNPVTGICTTSSGIPIVTTTASQSLTNKSVNGVTLNSSGSSSLYLNQAGGYTTPAGGGGGGSALNPACTFVSTATGCTITVSGLSVPTANVTSLIVQCATVTTGTYTNLVGTYTVTSSGGNLATVVTTFSPAAAGGSCTANLTSGGVNQFSGDGVLLNNTASTGNVAATLANAAAYTVWGNNTASSATPNYYTPAMVRLGQVVVGTAVANVTFSSIPSGFTNLKIIATTANSTASTHSLQCQFNGDTAAHYTNNTVVSSGAYPTPALSSTGATAASNVSCGNTASSSNTGYFSQDEITISNYGATVNNKTLAAFGVSIDTTPVAQQYNNYGVWLSTAAITSILLQPSTGNFITGSTFTLYGLQ